MKLPILKVLIAFFLFVSLTLVSDDRGPGKSCQTADAFTATCELLPPHDNLRPLISDYYHAPRHPPPRPPNLNHSQLALSSTAKQSIATVRLGIMKLMSYQNLFPQLDLFSLSPTPTFPQLLLCRKLPTSAKTSPLMVPQRRYRHNPEVGLCFGAEKQFRLSSICGPASSFVVALDISFSGRLYIRYF